MDKQSDPELPLRTKDIAADDDDGRNAGEGDADGDEDGDGPARWAGWTVLRPADGNAGAAGVGRALRAHYEGVIEEPIPDMLKDLLTRLG